MLATNQMQSVDDSIKRDIIALYQRQYGCKWSQNIHRQILPSSIRFVSVVYNVPIDYVNSIYNQLVHQFKGSGLSLPV